MQAAPRGLHHTDRVTLFASRSPSRTGTSDVRDQYASTITGVALYVLTHNIDDNFSVNIRMQMQRYRVLTHITQRTFR